MYNPPAGDPDMTADAEDTIYTGPLRELQVEGVGIVLARKPMPGSIPALAASASSKMSMTGKVDELTRFVQNHLGITGFDDLLIGMIEGRLPADAVQRIARAIATWGTARPTGPSSRSRR